MSGYNLLLELSVLRARLMLVHQQAYIVTVIKSHSEGCLLSSLSTKGKGASCEEKKRFKP